MDQENKIRRIHHYNHIFKKRTKINRNSYKEHVGNTCCSSSMRPGNSKISNKYPDKIYKKEVAVYQIVGHKIHSGNKLYRNSCIQSAITFKNEMQHSNAKICGRGKQKTNNYVPLKANFIIAGTKIALGNKYSLFDHTGLKIYFGVDYIADYNINYNDDKHISYQQFVNIMENIFNIIENNKDQDILIACEAGVNRSVSVIIGYMIRNKIDYYLALNTIEDEKNKINPNWNNLTNLSMRHLLRLYNNLINVY